MKSVAPVRSSCASTPMNRTRSPYLWWAAIRSGDSATHGSHQEAQMLTSTGWPFCCAIRSLKAVGSIVGKASTDDGHDGAPVTAAPLEVHAASASSAATAVATRASLDVMRAW